MMFPLMLDLTNVPIFLIGGSAGLQARLDTLVAYGATKIYIFTHAPDALSRTPANARIRTAWPDAAEFAAVRPGLVFIADVDDGLAAQWREVSHTVGAFVHVQDRIPLCDFHMPAILRHGHLQLTVSTDGVAPGLARILRDFLGEHVFGKEWESRVNEVRAARDKWRGEGLSMAQLGTAISDFMRARGWLVTK
jgi:precorrin-2 dehydrogenase/sirohydrochlorin ferrochelatase